ncbi:fimbrial protein [Rahnella aquatilis]|uniref:fimbrial protein n=1 Tax=Rahnella aquatilis TaxID=34038 RepID=UPI001E3EC9A9|nr:fimbrial protein [Rahnella aquatilis]
MEDNNVKKIKFFLFPAALITAFSAHSLELTPTENLSATFTSTIEAGTCTAIIQNDAGAATSQINFGDVYKSELAQKSKVQAFKLVFSSCSGVKSADITVRPTAGGCSGPSSNGDSFANNGGTATATAVELWRGATDTGSQLSCFDRTTSQNIALSSGGTMAMNARMVIAKDRMIADVLAGSFTAPITFVITYQ